MTELAGVNMGKTLRVLNVEESEGDVALLARHLSAANYELVTERVETADAMGDALRGREWDVILCDYTMPQFDALAALRVLSATGLDIPFLIISSTVGEETAVQAMLTGANDYLSKNNLKRLVPAIERELQEAENRRAQRRAEDEQRRLNTEIRIQRERLNNIVASVPGIVWEAWDEPDTTKQRIDFVSGHVETMLGYSVDEWLATPNFWLSIVHPDDREKAASDSASAFRCGENGTRTFRWIAKDGHIVCVESHSAVITDDRGAPVGLRGVTIDITERKQAADALRESEQRYRSVVETASDAIITIDETSTILLVNEAAERIFGYSSEELTGEALTKLMPAHLRSSHGAGMARYQQTGQRHLSWDHIELPGQHQSGREIPLELSFSEFAIDGRRYFTGIISDITERKRAEQALRESEESYKGLIDSAFDGVVITRGGLIQTSNVAFGNMFGYTVEELTGLDVLLLTAEPEIVRSQNSRDESRYETIGLKKDGTHFNIEVSAKVSRYKGATARLSAVRDITEHQRSAQALIDSEERYRDMVENATDIIYSHDLDGNYTSINNAGERVTGYTREESLRMNLRDTVAPEFVERAIQMIGAQQTGYGKTAYELEIIAKDGRRVPIEVKTRTIYEAGVPVGMQGIARDKTERKELEEQLLQARKLESIGRLAGSIAHDFNNMLTAITGYSDLALRKLAPDDPVRRDIEEVKKAGERSAVLTNQLLAFSRRQVLHPEVLSVNDVISETSSMLRRLIGEDIKLETILKPAAGCIKVDPGQLSQILMNLSINARDAMAGGGTLIIETGNVFTESYNLLGVLPGAYVTLSVSDNGVGMEPEVQKQIYDPFFTTKSVGEGTGLGLATVYGIVKQSGGHIFVHSEVGHGTTFKIYFPRVAKETEILETHDRQATFGLGTETILLVEDEKLVRSLTRKVLEACGYEVIEAVDGVGALEIMERSQNKIDLLMTDVVMPRMGGRELAEILRKRDPQLPILFVSGYTNDAILTHAGLQNNVNFAQKPYSLDDIGRKVRDLLDAGRHRSEV